MELKRLAGLRGIASNFLLIVPYGIETWRAWFRWSRTCLLIVPYGIETKMYQGINSYSLAFNRTLWN